MSGNVDAQDFLFPGQFLLNRPIRQLGQRIFGRLLLCQPPEQPMLPARPVTAQP